MIKHGADVHAHVEYGNAVMRAAYHAWINADGEQANDTDTWGRKGDFAANFFFFFFINAHCPFPSSSISLRIGWSLAGSLFMAKDQFGSEESVGKGSRGRMVVMTCLFVFECAFRASFRL